MGNQLRRKFVILSVILLINAQILSGCSKESAQPEGALTAEELLAEPVYNMPDNVYGQVKWVGRI